MNKLSARICRLQTCIKGTEADGGHDFMQFLTKYRNGVLHQMGLQFSHDARQFKGVQQQLARQENLAALFSTWGMADLEESIIRNLQQCLQKLVDLRVSRDMDGAGATLQQLQGAQIAKTNPQDSENTAKIRLLMSQEDLSFKKKVGLRDKRSGTKW
jgi:hypothetical protein